MDKVDAAIMRLREATQMSEQIYDFRHMEQPTNCLFSDGVCCYPVEDCPNCPMRPENFDPYWGLTKAEIG